MKTEAELRTALAAAEEGFRARLDEALVADKALRWATQIKDDAMVALTRHLEAQNGISGLSGNPGQDGPQEVFVGRRAGKTP